LQFLFSDDFVNIKEKISVKQLISKSDIIILGAPHSKYKKIKIPPKKFLVDSWGFFEK